MGLHTWRALVHSARCAAAVVWSLIIEYGTFYLESCTTPHMRYVMSLQLMTVIEDTRGPVGWSLGALARLWTAGRVCGISHNPASAARRTPWRRRLTSTQPM